MICWSCFHWAVCFVKENQPCIKCTRYIPAADVRSVVRGKWIDMADFELCSECKGTHLKEFQSYYGRTLWVKTPFCPNCGADMREER